MKHARTTHQTSLNLRLSLFAIPLARVRWALLSIALTPFLALANPTGGVVTAGQANISASPSLTTIQQHSVSAVIDWQQFGIGHGESVHFIQPSASAAVLNRVIGGSPSQIMGNLSANGRVFLINQHGVMFGSGSRLDVGSLVASTLDITNKDFLAGRYVFAGAQAPGAVTNDGVLTTRDGGFVVLVGGNVRNDGLIETRIGNLSLLSGSGLTLDIDDTGLVSYHIDAAALANAAGVVNTGELLADGGRVYMSAQLAQGLAATAVNNSGLVRATRINEQNGVIALEGLGGNTVNSGILNASSKSGHGSTVQILSDSDALITDGSPSPAKVLQQTGNTSSIVSGSTTGTNSVDTTNVDGVAITPPYNQAPYARAPDRVVVLLQHQLTSSVEENNSMSNPIVAPIIRDSSGKAALQCDAAGLGE